jgi:hypothetical protein
VLSLITIFEKNNKKASTECTSVCHDEKSRASGQASASEYLTKE